MKLTNDIRILIRESILSESEAKKAVDAAHVAMESLFEEFRIAALGFPEKKLLELEKRVRQSIKQYLDSPVVNGFALDKACGAVTFIFSDESRCSTDYGFFSKKLSSRYMPLPAGEYRKQYEKAINEINKREEILNILNGEVTAALASVNTIKQLIDAWPECEPFIPKTIGRPVTALAIRTEDLNKKLGLESKEVSK